MFHFFAAVVAAVGGVAVELFLLQI